MKTLSNYPGKIFMGVNDGEKIYLSAPSWDCGWYWGFGYLGNDNCHYHLRGLNKDKNLYDALIEHFGDSLKIRLSDLWTFCELIETFYTLKQTCEVLGRGGSHYTANPCVDIIKNSSEVERINNEVLPQIFEEIYKILIRNQDNDKLFKKLVSLNLKGDTSKVVDFMLENNIHTDDLKSIIELTRDDVSNIHGYYWKRYHANKN